MNEDLTHDLKTHKEKIDYVIVMWEDKLFTVLVTDKHNNGI